MNDLPPRIEVTVAASLETAWRALRDRTVLRQWHGWDTDGLDTEIESIYFTDVAEDSDRRGLRVNGGDRFTLLPDGGGVRVAVTRAPPSGDPEWDAYYDDITEGWTTFLHQLRFALERRPGGTRRTLFFHTEQLPLATLLDRLELAEIAEHTAGTPYAAVLAGEHVTGTVWFRSTHQLGLTVGTWGEGLLVLAGTPPTADRPNGATWAVLSTYDLDSTGFDQLARRWSDWWPEYTTTRPDDRV